jgi:hypothetical protein
MILALITIAALAIFGIACFYASWETRIDRRKRERAEDVAIWNKLLHDRETDDVLNWKNPARGRELAG